MGIWIDSVETLIQGESQGWISGFQENMRNSNGNLRRAKFKITTAKIPENCIVGTIEI